MSGKLKFKRLLSAVLCVFAALFLALVPVCFAAGAPAPDALTVGVPTDRCPVFYLDAETGESTGIGVDLMRSAAQAAGYTVTFQPITEGTLKDALDNPDYDVVMPFGSAVPSASGQSTIVSENLIQTPFTLVTQGSHAMPPLNELRVGMLRSLGAGAETVRQLYPGIEITLYDTMPECVRALRSGKVDALLHNSYVWSYVLQKPSYSDLAVQPSAMFSMDFRAGALDTPEGEAIMDRLNGGIAALTDTRRQAIVLDHTSRRLYRYDYSDYIYQYGAVLVLTLLLFAALVVISVQKWHTLQLEQEEKMRRLIDHDPLTGVWSMKGFRRRVEDLLRAHPDVPYMLAYTNIRNFKYINDSMGMAAGDELLRFWANRTLATLSEEEAMGRIDGDHFVVLRRMGGEERLAQDDKGVIDAVHSYFVDQGKGNRVMVCCGIYVLTPKDYQHIDVDHMLDFARVAEKRVRDTRRDGYEFYNPEQWEKGKRVAEISSRLSMAIETGELQVWYQPQVNYETGRIVGAEALCRWKHARLGWLRPAEFIPTLEESGLIYELDCFVWERACQDLQRWNQQGLHRFVSVNLSRCDLTEEQNIPRHFYDLIQRYDLSTDQLRIEITETAYAENPELLIQTTVKLREFGFQVEMDDFGSGYSSLNMLKEVPVDRIKLDLRFLTETGEPERGRIIISYMVQMIHSLGMNLIAEGVENAVQARFLQNRGCTEMQGFYFYKPMAVEEYEKLNERLELDASSCEDALQNETP